MRTPEIFSAVGRSLLSMMDDTMPPRDPDERRTTTAPNGRTSGSRL
jgi:hypothetical protein